VKNVDMSQLHFIVVGGLQNNVCLELTTRVIWSHDDVCEQIQSERKGDKCNKRMKQDLFAIIIITSENMTACCNAVRARRRRRRRKKKSLNAYSDNCVIGPQNQTTTWGG
jgi:hypothetical protein